MLGAGFLKQSYDSKPGKLSEGNLALMKSLAQKFSSGQRPLKFAIVGLLNTGIDFVTFVILYSYSDIPLLVANSIAYCAGIVNSFIWNKLWTFGDYEHHHTTSYQFVATLLVYGLGLALSNLIIAVFVILLPAAIAKLIAIAGTVCWTYWASKKYVYKSAGASIHER